MMLRHFGFGVNFTASCGDQKKQENEVQTKYTDIFKMESNSDGERPCRPSYANSFEQPKRTDPVNVDDIKIDLSDYFCSASSTSDESQVPVLVPMEHVKVFLRVKPITSEEGKNESKVFGPETSQNEFFEGSMRQVVRDFVQGCNHLVFTFGTTNSGKTYTFQGGASTEYPDCFKVMPWTEGDVGILPRTMDMLFKTIGGKLYTKMDLKPIRWRDYARLTKDQVEHQNSTNGEAPVPPMDVENLLNESEQSSRLSVDSFLKFSVWVSFFEIYNECFYDLLSPMSNDKKKKILRLAQDVKGYSYVKGLQWVQVSDAKEALSLFKLGRKHQSFASTKLNTCSSRSHSVFTIKILKIEDCEVPRVTRVHEVPPHIPFRESKLTHFFQGFFSGKGKIQMIVNISQCASACDETLNVLRFSTTAQKVIVTDASLLAHYQSSGRKSASGTLKPCCGKMASPMRSTSCLLNQSLEDVTEDDTEMEEEHNTSGEETKLQYEENKVLVGKEEYTALLNLVEDLKNKLIAEKKDKLLLELKIREEVTQEFTQYFAEREMDFKKCLSHERERLEEDSEKRLEIFKELVCDYAKSPNEEKLNYPPGSEQAEALKMNIQNERIQELMDIVVQKDDAITKLQDLVSHLEEAVKDYENTVTTIKRQLEEEKSNKVTESIPFKACGKSVSEVERKHCLEDETTVEEPPAKKVAKESNKKNTLEQEEIDHTEGNCSVNGMETVQLRVRIEHLQRYIRELEEECRREREKQERELEEKNVQLRNIIVTAKQIFIDKVSPPEVVQSDLVELYKHHLESATTDIDVVSLKDFLGSQKNKMETSEVNSVCISYFGMLRLNKDLSESSALVQNLKKDLQWKEEECTDLRDKLSDAKKQIQQVQEEVSRMRSEEKSLRNRVHELERIKKQFGEEQNIKKLAIQELKKEQLKNKKLEEVTEQYKKIHEDLRAKEKIIEDMRVTLEEQEQTQTEQDKALEANLEENKRLASVELETWKQKYRELSNHSTGDQQQKNMGSEKTSVNENNTELIKLQKELKESEAKYQTDRKKWLEEKNGLINQIKEAENLRNREMKNLAEDQQRHGKQKAEIERLVAELEEKDNNLQKWREERDQLVGALEVQLKALASNAIQKDKEIAELKQYALKDSGKDNETIIEELRKELADKDDLIKELKQSINRDNLQSLPAVPLLEEKQDKMCHSVNEEEHSETVLDTSEVSTENGKTSWLPKSVMQLRTRKPDKMETKQDGSRLPVRVKAVKSIKRRSSDDMDEDLVKSKKKKNATSATTSNSPSPSDKKMDLVKSKKKKNATSATTSNSPSPSDKKMIEECRSAGLVNANEKKNSSP
ncbi:hypothetical protein ASZ78_002148 [Callipepla squamata]|uniref:Kinesin motor domain-containing protein n=1 Tax=Callipepla squamata TaxID=9009 RepID=A0A226MYX4_CALSU|nr:hypothetical protein ASZ78_002148 [Callipepla squamata]